MIETSMTSRRTFLRGAAAAAGAFLLGSHVSFAARAFAAGPAAPGVFDPNVFLKIGADNLVTVIIKHFEMGQGVRTAMAIIAGEILALPTSRIRVSTVDTAVTPYDQQTSASRSTAAMGGAVTEASRDIRTYAPRILKDPVRWRFSHLRLTGPPASAESQRDSSIGVRTATP